MAVLYVENVPDDLYEALRSRAKGNRQSMAAEVLSLLRQNIPTDSELKRRKQLLSRILALQKQLPKPQESFPSTEEMLREDRAR